jgi:hypothetical protein
LTQRKGEERFAAPENLSEASAADSICRQNACRERVKVSKMQNLALERGAEMLDDVRDDQVRGGDPNPIRHRHGAGENK